MGKQKEISELSFIICSIVRDAENGLRHNIPVIEEFCKIAKSYQVIVFENDSKDGTKKLLRKWAANDSNVHVFCEDNGKFSGSYASESNSKNVNPFYSRRRIGTMVELRNQYMDYIWQHNLSADYLMVVDLDVDRINLSGIVSCFQHDAYWDAVTSFGYSFGPKLRTRYHDTFALEEYGKMDVPRTEKISMNCKTNIATRK